MSIERRDQERFSLNFQARISYRHIEEQIPEIVTESANISSPPQNSGSALLVSSSGRRKMESESFSIPITSSFRCIHQARRCNSGVPPTGFLPFCKSQSGPFLTSLLGEQSKPSICKNSLYIVNLFPSQYPG